MLRGAPKGALGLDVKTECVEGRAPSRPIYSKRHYKVVIARSASDAAI
jgi:hypothetical protein